MTKNKLFPGLPKYIGPKKGLFGLLHHDTLFEWSDDVNERISYVKNNKSKSEIKIRLNHMIYLPKSKFKDLYAAQAEYDKVVNAAYAEYDKIANAARAERDKVVKPACAEYDKVVNAAYAECRKVVNAACAEYDKVVNAARAEYDKVVSHNNEKVLNFVKKNIPDCKWNGGVIDFYKDIEL